MFVSPARSYRVDGHVLRLRSFFSIVIFHGRLTHAALYCPKMLLRHSHSQVFVPVCITYSISFVVLFFNVALHTLHWMPSRCGPHFVIVFRRLSFLWSCVCITYSLSSITLYITSLHARYTLYRQNVCLISSYSFAEHRLSGHGVYALFIHFSFILFHGFLYTGFSEFRQVTFLTSFSY